MSKDDTPEDALSTLQDPASLNQLPPEDALAVPHRPLRVRMPPQAMMTYIWEEVKDEEVRKRIMLACISNS